MDLFPIKLTARNANGPALVIIATVALLANLALLFVLATIISFGIRIGLGL